MTAKCVQSKTKHRSVADPLLNVRDLRTHFYVNGGVVKAVDGLNFVVQRGEIFGLVGESGCGKTVTALSLMRLVREPGRMIAGEVIFGGTHLETLSEGEMGDLRGREMSMIFQSPQSSLNPVFKVGGQVAEILRVHASLDRRTAWQKAIDLLRQMGIADAAQKAHAYPHELSIGQAQRVMIALSLAVESKLIIADEPTSALDVTIQRQILDLLEHTRTTMGTAIILITHDLGVIAESVDRVAVMYSGIFVEQAKVDALFHEPFHPYTQALIASASIRDESRLHSPLLKGLPPDPMHIPEGCRFADRCQARDKYRLEICRTREPQELWLTPDHSVRCWLYQDFEGHQAPLRESKTIPKRDRTG